MEKELTKNYYLKIIDDQISDIILQSNLVPCAVIVGGFVYDRLIEYEIPFKKNNVELVDLHSLAFGQYTLKIIKESIISINQGSCIVLASLLDKNLPII